MSGEFGMAVGRGEDDGRTIYCWVSGNTSVEVGGLAPMMREFRDMAFPRSERAGVQYVLISAERALEMFGTPRLVSESRTA